MKQASNSRAIRMSIGVMVLVISILGLFWLAAPPAATAAPAWPGTLHCTDWPVASMREGTNDKDQVIMGYEAYIYLRWGDKQQLPEIPSGPEWRVLTRPNQPFAVVYATTGPDAIIDPDPSGNPADVDGDSVPDYAERIYSCLVTAHARYRAYYSFQDDYLFHWLKLAVNGTELGDGVYPLVIQDTKGEYGAANRWVLFDIPRAITFGNPVKASYIEVHRDASPWKDTPPWTYPWIENTVYHELYHTYQKHYKGLIGVDDMWLNEGTTMYAVDQALLPPCRADLHNPPRIISPTVTLGDCYTPSIYERYSETVIGSLADSLFKQPWLGMSRDNAALRGGASSYSSVLFWYYAQQYLQQQAGSPIDHDVVKSFWLNGAGLQSTIYDWAADLYPNGGLGKLYHRFMIDNYVQTVPWPGYGNPYFRASTHWAGWTGDFGIDQIASGLRGSVQPKN